RADSLAFFRTMPRVCCPRVCSAEACGVAFSTLRTGEVGGVAASKRMAMNALLAIHTACRTFYRRFPRETEVAGTKKGPAGPFLFGCADYFFIRMVPCCA